jgi:hypothetical protein
MFDTPLKVTDADLLLIILRQVGLEDLGLGAPLGRRTWSLPFYCCLAPVAIVVRRCIFLGSLYAKMFGSEFEPGVHLCVALGTGA